MSLKESGEKEVDRWGDWSLRHWARPRREQPQGSPGSATATRSTSSVPITYQGTQYTWTLGRYILFLTVTHGADQGQTVCAVFVH
jgi:hypothetical protein